MIETPTLPAHGIVRLYATGERITPESAEHGDAAERGWTRDVGASEFYDSRNDVAPVLELHVYSDPDHGTWLSEYAPHDSRPMGYGSADEYSDALESLARVLQSLGAFHTDDGSTLYASDETILDYASDSHYMYALHAHVKHYDAARGWVEDDVDALALFGHDWQHGRFTGARTCSRCGILPLDSHDALTACTGRAA